MCKSGFSGTRDLCGFRAAGISCRDVVGTPGCVVAVLRRLVLGRDAMVAAARWCGSLGCIAVRVHSQLRAAGSLSRKECEKSCGCIVAAWLRESGDGMREVVNLVRLDAWLAVRAIAVVVVWSPFWILFRGSKGASDYVFALSLILLVMMMGAFYGGFLAEGMRGHV